MNSPLDLVQLVFMFGSVTVHGGMQRGGRGQGRNSGSRNSKDVLKFDGDYDFEEANAKFEKDKIVDELSQKLKISKFSKTILVMYMYSLYSVLPTQVRICSACAYSKLLSHNVFCRHCTSIFYFH